MPHMGKRLRIAKMLHGDAHPLLRDGVELAGYPFADSVVFVFHIFVFVIARNVRPAAFLPHGIPVAAPTCGRRVRGGEPNEDDKDAAKTRMRDTLQKSGVP